MTFHMLAGVDRPPDATVALRLDYDEAGRALLVEWADGAVQHIPFAELRRACPCAICSGELGRPGRFDVEPDLREGEDELADIHLVGAYGMGARWADGHATGIYTFAHLRRLGDAASTPPEQGAPGGV